MYDLRLMLSKCGRAKYVSHLDMFRLMCRAVRRAEIPLWYTEGFNPHPYISFLSALSLGVEGMAEPVDIKIIGDMKPDEVKNRLNACLPEGFSVKSAAAPFNKPAEIAAAEYYIPLDYADISAAQLRLALESGTLSCMKSGKSGGKKLMKSVNVSEHIRKYEITEGEQALELQIVLDAGNNFNLNPFNFLDAVSEQLGRKIYSCGIKRISLLCADLSPFA